MAMKYPRFISCGLRTGWYSQAVEKKLLPDIFKRALLPILVMKKTVGGQGAQDAWDN
jgi:hypothetical protein